MRKIISCFFALNLEFISQQSISKNFPDQNTNVKEYMSNTENSEEKISGKKFEILLIAFYEFKKMQKNISDFEIYIQDNNEDVEITFVPNFSPGEKILGGKTSLGRSITYTISKKTKEIIKSNYHR
ncbi:hypothetical protein [Janthinobacterium lividum]|uniref:Uncharacterized protein n=2 Tax=Janthinobacterium TaxID=29580 RepID=A0ABU0XWL3_9BURK|nr:hypothetical protein [Janthinobacterium lividum]MDQ4627953.1 hypothetical protein [Janthinobacterium lividum]MDQ4676771.1 hypothetical protein [Janthinobacterium lividum]MDQ4686757.1 hypothetical protein [Janthinobacterium lividum]